MNDAFRIFYMVVINVLVCYFWAGFVYYAFVKPKIKRVLKDEQI